MTAGEDRAEAHRRIKASPEVDYALLVDDERRPLGWLAMRDLGGSGRIEPDEATPGAPTVQPETTLRDALSALLGSSVQLGVVVDDRDRVLGLVSVDAIGDRLREPVRGIDGQGHEPGAAAS